MPALRPFLGALALTALLAARTAPVAAEDLVLTAAANLPCQGLLCPLFTEAASAMATTAGIRP